MKIALVFSLSLAGMAYASASHCPFPEVAVIVDGTPVHTYHHSGTTYLEANRGKEYAIRITNPTGWPIAVALSVDGLNTIDARHIEASAARKWVLGPYETITISGWQTNESHARRFYFTTEERSYGAWLGKTDNLGIISAVFFREKARSIERPIPGPGASTRCERDGNSAESKSRSSQQSESGAAATDADDYAATGIGRRVDHRVRWVRMDLEDRPFATVNLRYEFHPTLVRLGVLPPDANIDPLVRRGNARGFRDSVYCPEP